MSPIGDAGPTDAEGGYQAAQTLPMQQTQRWGQQLTSGFQTFVQRTAQTVEENPWLKDALAASTLESVREGEALTGAQPYQPRPTISSEAANQQYGVPGYLRFNQPVAEDDAALQNEMARNKQWSDTVMARTDPHLLSDIGFSLAGAMTDPTTAALMLSPVGEGLETAVFGERAAGAAADATRGVGKVGQLWNGVPQALGRSVVANLPYVAKDAALDYGTGHGDDFDMGQELANVAGFSVLHAGLHAGMNALGWFGTPRAPLEPTEAAGGEAGVHVPGEPRPPPQAPEIGPGEPAAVLPPAEAPTVEPGTPAPPAERAARPEPSPAIAPTPSGPARPVEVDRLSPDEQRAAHVLAVTRAANDEPVDVARLVNQALDRPAVERLDEKGAITSVDSWRPIPEEARLGDRAITTRGREVPIKFGLVEMSDLVTSHGDDMEVNGQYPAELQPRERDRAGAHAKNLQLEKELNPKRLMGDVGAESGAPLVSPAGEVESGNGRTIALRRSAATGTAAYQRYVTELQAQGFPVEGMRQPVLVRMRTEPMTGAQRASLAHEMNADVTERMSAPEQAMADAQKMDPATMAALGDSEDIAARRRFSRTFIERVAPDQINEMVDQQGHLSAAGERRIAAALVAKAYGDKDLVEALYDSSENTLRGIGNALQGAAPIWAAMRASIERGETPAAFDLNPSLVSAVMLVKGARDAGEGVSKFIQMRLIEQDMFTGDSVSQATEALLRLFYRNEEFTQARGADKVAEVLRDYARYAMLPEHQGGADIFGHEASADESVAALRATYAKAQRGWDERAGVQRAPGESSGGTAGLGGAAEGPGVRFREPGGEGNQPQDGGLHEPGGGGPDQGGAGARGDGGEPIGERAADAEAGGAGPAVSGESGREPAAAEAAVNPATAARVIAADPELQALQRDLDGIEAETGEPIQYEGHDPATLAEAVRAAATCLKGEL
jgi:hypothetical protein